MIFQKQSIAIILACVASTASAFSVIPSSTSSAIVTKPYSIANYGMQTSSPLFMSDNDVVETTEETSAEEGDSSETEKPQEDISKVAYVVNLNYGEYIYIMVHLCISSFSKEYPICLHPNLIKNH